MQFDIVMPMHAGVVLSKLRGIRGKRFIYSDYETKFNVIVFRSCDDPNRDI